MVILIADEFSIFVILKQKQHTLDTTNLLMYLEKEPAEPKSPVHSDFCIRSNCIEKRKK
jgi:hypothetical protein